MRRRVIRNLAWIGLALTLVTGGALPGSAQQTDTTDDAVFTIERVGTIDLLKCCASPLQQAACVLF